MLFITALALNKSFQVVQKQRIPSPKFSCTGWQLLEYSFSLENKANLTFHEELYSLVAGSPDVNGGCFV